MTQNSQNGWFYIKHSRDEHPDADAFNLHAHGVYELLLFLSGDITYLVEGNTYRPSSGDIILFGIAETHKVEVNSDKPYERIVIQFDKTILSAVDPEYGLCDIFNPKSAGNMKVVHSESFGNSLWRKCIDRLLTLENEPLGVMSYLLPFLWEMKSAAENIMEIGDRKQLSARIVRYINDNISSQLTPEEIAEKFYISRTSLYKLFKDTTGTTVHNYISVKRLFTARELLMRGEKPTSVYSKCGFNDYTTFFRAYRQKFGISPKEQVRE